LAEELITQIYLEKPPEDETDMMIETLLESMKRLNNRHVCGLQGFGYPGDVCPMCEKQSEERKRKIE